MMESEDAPATRELLAFRRRVDALFGSPHATAYVETLPSQVVAPPRTPDEVLSSRLEDALARLGAEPAEGVLHLRKSVTLHDGRVVSMVGDATPLGADDDVRIVTVTTSVLDAQRMRVETNVLVFERERLS